MAGSVEPRGYGPEAPLETLMQADLRLSGDRYARLLSAGKTVYLFIFPFEIIH